jgi:hypothetical protein
VIHLVGSDTWPFYSKKETPFTHICVSLRDRAPIEPQEIKGKEVTFIVPPLLGCSSTKIRKYLKQHPEHYQNGSPLEHLDSKVLDYVRSTKLYYRSPEEHLSRVKDKIKKHLKEVYKINEKELICLNDVGQGGNSGDLTFVSNQYFIKAFVRGTHQTDLMNEVGGNKFLNSLSLTWCSAINPLWEVNKSSYSHMGLPFVEKRDLAKVFKSLNGDELVSMCLYVGRALSELHHSHHFTIQPSRLEEETKKLNARAQHCLVRSSNMTNEQFEHSYREFLTNPGVHTYVHGDANLSNFIVDPETGHVIFLDLNRFFKLRTDEGSPLGFPAEDYYRFYYGLSWLNQSFPIPASTLNNAQKAFERGYQCYPSLITPQAHTYFSLYWQLRNS